MNPDSLVLQVILEKQQTIEALRAENAQLRQHIDALASIDEESADPTAPDVLVEEDAAANVEEVSL